MKMTDVLCKAFIFFTENAYVMKVRVKYCHSHLHGSWLRVKMQLLSKKALITKYIVEASIHQLCVLGDNISNKKKLHLFHNQ
jgi:hypothetical protein